MHRAILAALALAAMSTISAITRAGNDDEVIVGNEAAMAGGAVTATARTGSSLYYNPAGLLNVTMSSIDASGSAYGIRLYQADRILQIGNREGQSAEVSEIVVIPSAVSYVRPIGDDVRLGIGLFVNRWSDFSLRAREAAGETQALLTVASRDQKADAVLGAGFRLTEGLRLGTSLHVVYSTQESSVQLGAGNAFSNFTVSSLSSSTGVGLRLGTGLQWDIAGGLVMGIGLWSPSARVYSKFTDGTLVAVGGTSQFFDAPVTEDEQWGWEWEHPARARLGLAYEFDEQSWLSVDGDVRPPLRNDDLAIDNEVEFNLRVGGIWGITPEWAIGAGAFTDRASENALDAVDFYGGTLGVRYRNERRLDPETEEEERLVFETTVGLRYAYGAGSVGAIRNDIRDDGEITISEILVDFAIHEITLHVGGALRF